MDGLLPWRKAILRCKGKMYGFSLISASPSAPWDFPIRGENV
jgi:hypothetical protein